MFDFVAFVLTQTFHPSSFPIVIQTHCTDTQATAFTKIPGKKQSTGWNDVVRHITNGVTVANPELCVTLPTVTI